MTITAAQNETLVWKQPAQLWILTAVASVLLYVTFSSGLQYMVSAWNGSGEYSYGYLIPFISLFLIWQRKDILQKLPFEGSWLGLVLLVFGAFMYLAGELATLYSVVQYAFVVMLAGLIYALVGWRAFRIVVIPLIILLFMIPLPQFLFNNLSSQLQLLSSQIGVWFIKLFGISVFLQGNVIDLGAMKLQVVEACSGLRYLFPLMTFGFITAYFYQAALWRRGFIFLSTIPITILMNSFRIGAIGVTVEYWGQAAAEGFLHDFEGWIVFMACTAMLFLEMWLLTRIGRDVRPLQEIFGLDFPTPTPKHARFKVRSIPTQFYVAALLLAGVTVFSLLLPQRQEIVPRHAPYSAFPTKIGQWQGRPDKLEKIYVDILKFEDYILANYDSAGNRQINFYVAYYGSQRKGASAHSPRSCIPGDGWQIKDLSQRTLLPATDTRPALRVNRTVIQKGEYGQLVYYWFQQRGRVITNEYLVKWYIFWDALTRNRTDGALVRLTTPLQPGQDIGSADETLMNFVGSVYSELPAYIPD